MLTALEGRRDLVMPGGWPAASRQLIASDNTEVRSLAIRLALAFGDEDAKRHLRKQAADSQAKAAQRIEAVKALSDIGDSDLRPILEDLIARGDLREAALNGVAAYDAASIPPVILKHYERFTLAEKQAAVATLASRPAFARELLGAVERKLVPRGDVSTFIARQIDALGDKALTTTLNRVWGQVRKPSGDRAAIIKAFKKKLTAEPLVASTETLTRGRKVFHEKCGGCHVLFDAGRKVGPNLTGSQRNNIDYLLENLLDPSAVVPRDYRMTRFAMESGRVLTGIVASETDAAVTVKTPTADVLLSVSEIRVRKQSSVSIMPEGLLEKMRDADLRALFAYLASPKQVPLSSSNE